MKNYFPKKEDALLQAKMMKLGFKVYPIVTKTGKNAPCILAFEYKGKETVSKQPAFDQAYLGYKVHELYRLLHERIKHKL